MSLYTFLLNACSIYVEYDIYSDYIRIIRFYVYNK